VLKEPVNTHRDEADHVLGSKVQAESSSATWLHKPYVRPPHVIPYDPPISQEGSHHRSGVAPPVDGIILGVYQSLHPREKKTKRKGERIRNV
jgi:hypothetical protein